MGLGSGGGGGIPNVDLEASNLPIVGPLFPDEATQRMEEEMVRAGRATAAYRPEVAQARQNAILNQMATLQGGNDIITAMAGGRQMFNPDNMQAPIMGPSMYRQGAMKGVDDPETQQRKIAAGQPLHDVYERTKRIQGQPVAPEDNYLAGIVPGADIRSGFAPDIWDAPGESFSNPEDTIYFQSDSPYNIKNDGVYQALQTPWEWQPENGRW